MRKSRIRRMITTVLISMVVGLLLMVSSPTYSASADPACQTNSVYILWARGSNQVFDDVEAAQFKNHLFYALDAIGLTTHEWAELGNLDNDRMLELGEYPAVKAPEGNFNGEYSSSVAIGTDELVTHLNQRYGSGRGDRNCYNETAIIGGYSQGADVIGWALERDGGGGYAALSTAAKSHIGYVALYGDPRMDHRECPNSWWVRGSVACGLAGILGARTPYARDTFKYRFGSWCDQYDGVCTIAADPINGSHSTAYRNWWIWQSAAEIAHTAQVTRCAFVTCVAYQHYIAADASIYGRTSIGSNGWTQEVGPGNASKISAGGSNVMFIRGDAAVFARVGIGNTWTQEVGPGNANAIAVSSTGVEMFVRGDAAIFAKNGIGTHTWIEEVSSGNADAISVGGNTQMFRRGDKAVFAKNTVSANGWTRETPPDAAVKIASGSTGVQMYINSSLTVFARRDIGENGWVQETDLGNAITIAVGGETQMFLRHDGAVYAKNWIGYGGWIEQASAGNAVAIAACQDGTMMFRRNDSAVFVKRGLAANWVQSSDPGTVAAIACG